MVSRSSLLQGIFGVFFYASHLAAASISVTVSCSNGGLLSDLPIFVYDANFQSVSDISTTDSQGVFVIENSELYTTPFYFYFTARDGSTCGAYSVNLIDPSNGQVDLAYYPTSLPCSCANL